MAASVSSQRILALLAAGRNAPALVVPHQGVRLTYSELGALTATVAHSLSSLGYARGDRLAMCLGSCAENAVTQLAASIAGYSVCTVKAVDQLTAKAAELNCRGVLVADADATETAAAIEGSPLAMHVVEELAGGSGAAPTPLAALATEHAKFAYYNSAKATPLATLVAQGEACAAELQLSSADVICLPVTLNHSMGMGFGVLAALSSGASLVLPSPAPDADRTLAALRDEQCTILFADSHTYKNLPEGSTRSDQPKLRGGVIKIGSGESFGQYTRLAEPRAWAGVELTTVGKPAATAGGHGHGK